MPILEGGLWLFMVVLASIFTFISIKVADKASMAFHLLAVALFMGLSAFHAAGYEVATSTTSYTYDGAGTLMFNQTQNDTYIPGGVTASWISYLFLGFALFNIFLVFKQVVRL